MSKVEIELHTIATYNNKQYELQDLLNDLINMNLKLQQRIDKAIEYINNHIEEIYDEEYETNYRCDAISGDDLLEILRGEDKE